MNTNKLNRRAAKNEAQQKMYEHFITLKYTSPAKARFLAKQSVQNESAKVLKAGLNLVDSYN
jgi:hypothetical protein